MRVISGSKKGLRLYSVKSSVVRPTSDRTKKVIFDVLDHLTDYNYVLDVFAGTGGLGIEALSRGAAKAIFVESNKQVLRILRLNLERAAFLDRAEILAVSAVQSLARLGKMHSKFDLILADPPYRQHLARQTLRLVHKHKLLEEGGWMVIEHGPEEGLSDREGTLRLIEQKRVGDSLVSFYKNE